MKRKILTQEQTDNIRAQVADLSGTKTLPQAQKANITAQVADLSGTRILTQAQVAEILGVTTDTLEAWRYKRRYGLAYIKVGSLIRYFAKDVEAFLQSRRVSGDGQNSDGPRRVRRSRRAA
jgi:hypothetical protein